MDTINIADQVRNAFPFTVDKYPLSGPDGMRTPMYGLFRSDTGECASHMAVSRYYHPHTTDDVVALVEACQTAFSSDTAKVSCAFDRGHHVIVGPSSVRRQAIFGTTDNVFPRVLIRAGYGGQAFKTSLGTYRDVCRNLAVMRMVDGITQSIHHDSGLRDRMTELVQTFSSLAAQWDNLVEAIRGMESRRVRLNDFLLAMYGEPGQSKRAETMHRGRTEAIMHRIIRERMQTGRPDLGYDWVVTGWEAYNAVQGYAQHDSRRHGNPSDIERAVMAIGDNNVTKAERLTLDLAI